MIRFFSLCLVSLTMYRPVWWCSMADTFHSSDCSWFSCYCSWQLLHFTACCSVLLRKFPQKVYFQNFHYWLPSRFSSLISAMMSSSVGAPRIPVRTVRTVRTPTDSLRSSPLFPSPAFWWPPLPCWRDSCWSQTSCCSLWCCAGRGDQVQWYHHDLWWACQDLWLSPSHTLGLR